MNGHLFEIPVGRLWFILQGNFQKISVNQTFKVFPIRYYAIPEALQLVPVKNN